MGNALAIRARVVDVELGSAVTAAEVQMEKTQSLTALLEKGAREVEIGSGVGARTTVGQNKVTRSTPIPSKLHKNFKNLTIALDSLRPLSDNSVIVTLSFLNRGQKEVLVALDGDSWGQIKKQNIYVTDNAGNRYDFKGSNSIGAAHFINVRRGSRGWLTCPPSTEVTAAITFSPPRNIEKRGTVFTTSIPIHMGKFYIDEHQYTRVSQEGNFSIYFRDVAPM